MELTWATVYDNACQRFGGQTPGTELEATLTTAFATSPAALIAAIGKAGAAFDNGKAHSPWGIVRSETPTPRKHEPPSPPTPPPATKPKPSPSPNATSA
jgi:hypothetical protein